MFGRRKWREEYLDMVLHCQHLENKIDTLSREKERWVIECSLWREKAQHLVRKPKRQTKRKTQDLNG